jgi:type I restriction enzyme, S subunit
MSDWKETGIGLIPKDWNVKKFENILKIPLRNGLNKPSNIRGFGYKMVNMNEIFANDIIKDIPMDLVPLTENEKQTSFLKKYDILFARQSLVFDGAGKCSIFLGEDKNVCFESHIIRARIDENISNPVFYYYLFFSKRGKRILRTIVEQAVVAGIRGSDLRELIIPCPPKEEQDEIVAILSCLDNKIDNLRRQNETLEKIAQTLFKHWFIDFEFPNDEGKPYKSSGGAMVASELRDIPAGWRVGKLGEEVETVGGGTPSTTEPSYWENGDIYWYSPTDLTKSKTVFSLDTSKKITKLGLDKSSARLFPKYSILMTSRATIGEVTINTNYACTNQGFITLIPNSLFDTFYLFCWLKTQLTKVNLLASGSTFPELSKSDFRNFDFLIPSNHLVLGFRELVTPLFLRIETNTKQIQTLTKTRDALLPKLMSGQIRVKD